MKIFFLILLNLGSLVYSSEQLTGRIVDKKTQGYEEARLVSNYYPSKDRFPEAIVFAQNAGDVQNGILWARLNNKEVRIRSGGHNHEAFSTATGALVIDVSEMKHFSLDAVNQMVTVGPGVTGKELYSKLYEHGLTQAGGTCSDVGISGLILTGGMGPLLRKEGLACDSLVALEMVDAKGKMIHATKDNEHNDLFWASCGGGGGNFGVVTSLTLKVYPAPDVTWFNIGWDWTASVEEIIQTWQDLFIKPDKKWFSHLDVWAKSFSVEKFKKQPVKALGVYYGTPEEAKVALAPLLKIGKPSIVIDTVTWKKAIEEFEEATAVFITAKPEYKSTGAFAKNQLPQEAIKKITSALEKAPSPLFNFLLFSLGGKAAEISPTETAYFYRQSPFFVCYTNQWLNENEDRSQIAALDALRTELLPFADGDYLGNPDRSLKNYLQDYYGGNLQRLMQIKRKYDPENFFKFEQSIPISQTE